MLKIILKIFLFFFVFNTSYNSFSQKFKKPQNLPRYDFKKLHFGFSLGINSLDFNEKLLKSIIIDDSINVVQTKNQLGFNLGIVSNLRLGKYTDLRFTPRLVFGERHIDFFLSDIKTTKIIESTLIDFPLNIKYKSERYNNLRTYIITGLKYSVDIASQKEVNNNNLEIIKLNKNDFLAEFGIGFDFYLPYFKFSPQLKLSSGHLDLLSNRNLLFTRYFRNLKSRNWMLSITFE
tara:strand:+ start:3521 stop:4222 length:702 start_codon:yes stop_codon:yes gene_type:complete